jgi:hypothetical protein
LTFTEAQMRADLEGEIKLAAPLAVVFDWWALGGDERQWPGKLVSPNDQDRVHGYVITPRRTYSVRENPNCVRQFFTYQIRGLHWYETGKRDANSDLTHVAELIAISQRFANKSNLPKSIRRIAEDSELDFRIELDIYGGQLLHKSLGEITIEQC